MSPGVDDGALRPHETTARRWVCALAHLKARNVRSELGHDHPPTIVLGADTVVVKNDIIIGQPRDERDAARILQLLSDGSHIVITGVALLRSDSDRRILFCDDARVRVGPLDGRAVRQYLDSGDWRGKAGAYNLYERIEAGWPIRFEGDPTTIMGLPMRKLTPTLRELGVLT